MANIKELIQSIEAADSSFDEKLAAINQMEETLVAMRQQEETAVQENVDLIVEAIKVMEDKVNAQLEIAKSIVPEKGDKGDKGLDGKQGKDGRDGKDGKDGINGKDGVDGKDGVSVTDAKIDFDGSLVITLSTGQEINVGEVVAPELQEKIKLVTSGGAGTVLPSQTGNANKYLKTDGTALSWATVSSSSGTVTSVGGTGTVNGITLTGTVTSSGNLTLGGTLSGIGNSQLTNSSITFGSTAQALGSTVSGLSGVTIDNGVIGGNTAVAGTFTTLSGTTSVTTPIVQNSSAAAIAFKTNSASSAITQFNIAHTASAVNYLQVTGAATGSFPIISPQGSDGNISLQIYAKGTGAVNFWTSNGGSRQFQVTHTAGTIVNYATATGNIAGASPAFAVAGTDTDIDLTLTPKNAGAVRFGTYTASALLPVAGYITIKDSGGTTRRLLVG